MNRAIAAVSEGGKPSTLTRHEWDKVLEALPVLVKAKQRKLKALADDYRLQRATLGQEINDINKLIQKNKTKTFNKFKVKI